ncbi:2-hydroxyacyl-CoA dehydratase subunit D [Zhaonella formicivorans]|uniref:2-hydroxyacyl-CoA dehydratase subunit D n=1 Tax=Zhaonella formicivorans TaxID=2528593 RepID=UPI001D120CC5|nr:2-hydroxyacyl-CoA dehydratase family protein [Zhaonella formicivorans]
MGREAASVYESARDIAIKWHENGGKVIGYFCSCLPEELLHAAGVLPFRIIAGSKIDLVLKECDFLDGVVSSHPYETFSGKFHHHLSIPDPRADESIITFEKEIEILINSMEKELINCVISEEALLKSIQIYNRSRSLFHELDIARRQGNLDSSILYEAIHGSMGISREESIPLLEALVSDARPAIGQKIDKFRVHLSGSILTDLGLIRLMENNGLQIVSDDLCTGSRYFENLVDETKPPITALAERYLKSMPCTCMFPENLRMDHFCQKAQINKVDGVVVLLEKYCDSYLFDSPEVRKRFNEMGIPVLFLAGEDAGISQEQITAQIQEFKEAINKKKLHFEGKS